MIKMKYLFIHGRLNDKQIIVLLNKSKSSVDINLNVDHNEYYSDILNGNEFIPVEEQKYQV